MALFVFVAIIFATIAAWPSSTISITAHANGDFTCESRAYTKQELKAAVLDAVAHRKRWFISPTAQINFEPGVEFAKVPQVLNVLASAGCEKVQLGLPPELASKMSKPGLLSEP